MTLIFGSRYYHVFREGEIDHMIEKYVQKNLHNGMKCKNEKIFRQIKEILHQIKENIMNSSYLAFHSSWNLIICICTLVHIMYLYIWFKYLWKFSIYPHNIWIEVYSMMGQVTLLAFVLNFYPPKSCFRILTPYLEF